MRRTLHEQLTLVPAMVDHEHARELQAMSEWLDAARRAVELVYADLVRGGVDPNNGREGMSAERVLRCAVAKQMNGWSFEELAFHIGDSFSYRAFCRFGLGDKAPTKTTLKRNLKRVRPETWEAINRLLLAQANNHGIEQGRKVRTDCTVVATNIHAPTDSSLLWDCVRVLTRLMGRASELVPVHFTDHRRRAKRRAIGIQHAATMAKRLPLYRDLLKVTHKVIGYARTVVASLERYHGRSVTDEVANELRHYLGLTYQVVDQTQRRVLRGETVASADKVVSIFEPHTDIIVKDRRETHYGHKVALSTGASNLVLDCVIEDGNPPDSRLTVMMLQRQLDIYGRPPRQVSLDGGFASKANLADLQRLGVQDVCFTKASFLKVTDMVKSSWVYRRLRRFRAGIEAGISLLKRCFGLSRCLSKGYDGFRAYTWASIVSHNLLVLARHHLA